MTAWTDHVKAYREKHNCSLKEAMTKAKDTYKSTKEDKPKEVKPKVKKQKEPELIEDIEEEIQEVKIKVKKNKKK